MEETNDLDTFVSHGPGAPTNVIPCDALQPDAYLLRLEYQSSPAQVSFNGQVLITWNVLRDTCTMRLHCYSNIRLGVMKLWSDEQDGAPSVVTSPIKQEYDEAQEWVTYTFEEGVMCVGKNVKCSIEFVTNATRIIPRQGDKGWHGLYYKGYQSRVQSFVGEPYVSVHSNMFLTQFEPCNARQLFPCVDQPCTKAAFRLHIVIPAHQTCISNGRVQVEQVLEQRSFEELPMKRLCFQTVLSIPTYLIAIVIGEFDVIKRNVTLPNFDSSGRLSGERNTLIRVFCPLERAGEGAFATDLSVKALSFFTNLFRVNYSFDKMDIVPHELLPILGMENWGCITFRESYCLADIGVTAVSRVQRIARLFGHEICHMWFGDSTSLKWWTYLWLKEGFARMMEYVFVDAHFSGWCYWYHFYKEIYCSALLKDEGSSTHPIQARVDHPHECATQFDAISYGKGASVLRMVALFVGWNTFWDAVRLYLRTYENQCCSAVDLWSAFDAVLPPNSDAHGYSISSVMSGWVNKARHPVVRCRLQRREGDGGLELHCEQFIAETKMSWSTVGGPQDLHNTRSDFVIPMLVKSSSGTKRLMMSESSQVFPLESNSQWYHLNGEAAGFYRVHYSTHMWMSVFSAAKVGRLTPLEVSSTAADVLELFLGGAEVDPCVLAAAYSVMGGQQDPNIWAPLLEPTLRLLMLAEGNACWEGVRSVVVQSIMALSTVIGADMLSAPSAMDRRDWRTYLRVLTACGSPMLHQQVLSCEAKALALCQEAPRGALASEARDVLCAACRLDSVSAARLASTTIAMMNESDVATGVNDAVQKAVWHCDSPTVLDILLPTETDVKSLHTTASHCRLAVTSCPLVRNRLVDRVCSLMTKMPQQLPILLTIMRMCIDSMSLCPPSQQLLEELQAMPDVSPLLDSSGVLTWAPYQWKMLHRMDMHDWQADVEWVSV